MHHVLSHAFLYSLTQTTVHGIFQYDGTHIKKKRKLDPVSGRNDDQLMSGYFMNHRHCMKRDKWLMTDSIKRLF